MYTVSEIHLIKFHLALLCEDDDGRIEIIRRFNAGEALRPQDYMLILSVFSEMANDVKINRSITAIREKTLLALGRSGLVN